MRGDAEERVVLFVADAKAHFRVFVFPSSFPTPRKERKCLRLRFPSSGARQTHVQVYTLRRLRTRVLPQFPLHLSFRRAAHMCMRTPSASLYLFLSHALEFPDPSGEHTHRDIWDRLLLLACACVDALSSSS